MDAALNSSPPGLSLGCILTSTDGSSKVVRLASRFPFSARCRHGDNHALGSGGCGWRPLPHRPVEMS
eukprot:391605-Hanusia_phi.AAC.1